MKRILLVLAAILSVTQTLISCSSPGGDKASNQYRSADESRPLVDPKYSLAADRQAMQDMRAQIPEDKRQINDEMAYILQLFSETKKAPSEIRNQFDTAVRKKRTQFDKDIKRERESFTDSERKKRDSFLKEQKQTRDQFNKSKQNRDQKNEFYRDQDQKRSEYFADERDRRNDFESDVRERRKSFEDYMREKNNEFNQEHRTYSKRYDEMKKAAKQPPTSNNDAVYDLDQELLKAKGIPGTPLESGE